jgi:hypothetical protein
MHTEQLFPPGAHAAGLFVFGICHVTVFDLALSTLAELDRLVVRIERIRPQSHHNPAQFYEDRSDVAEEARAIAVRLRASLRAGAERPAITSLAGAARPPVGAKEIVI